MSCKRKSGPSRELIQAYRYEMTLEALRFILTDAGWLKYDVANYLEVDYDHINKLLTRSYYPVDTQLMRKVKKLYQQKYGRYQWFHFYSHIKSSRLSPSKHDQSNQQND